MHKLITWTTSIGGATMLLALAVGGTLLTNGASDDTPLTTSDGVMAMAVLALFCCGAVSLATAAVLYAVHAWMRRSESTLVETAEQTGRWKQVADDLRHNPPTPDATAAVLGMIRERHS